MSETEAIRRIDAARESGKIELEITHLKLERLPESLFALEDLEVLICHNNRLTEWPRELSSMRRLKRIFLESNDLTELPEDAAALPQLEVLSLNGNRLTAMPKALWHTGLKELYLTGNPLKSLPPEMGALKSLEKLYLGDTQIRKLPEEIGDLETLKTLHLPNNRLTALPASLSRLDRLEVLNLSGNRLTALPGAVVALPALKTINVSKNPLPAAVVQAAGKGPSVLRPVIERQTLPGIRLRVSGDIALHELRAYLSAVEHVFNSFLVYESVVNDVAKQRKDAPGGEAVIHLPDWPSTRESVSARVKDNKRLFVRDLQVGLSGAVELATRSTRTAALKHLVTAIRRETGAVLDRDIETAFTAKTALLEEAGISESDMRRLLSELIDAPREALLAFVRRGIIRDATLVNPNR